MRSWNMRATIAIVGASALIAFISCGDEPTPTEVGESAESASRPSAQSVEAPPLPPEVLVGAGDIASCSTNNDAATATLVKGIPGTVFTVGDNAYTKGSASEYNKCYHPTWGQFKTRTKPAPGERDYGTTNASGYFGYFGAAAGDPAKGYYSYDLGAWHVVVLNSRLSTSVGSAQEQWLRGDLGATQKACVVAIWHHPRFTSSASPNAAVKPLWDVLHGAGAEIVVNAHSRNYERFAPQNPDGIADPTYGVRQFVVGTGGAGSSSFGTPRANSEVRSTGTPGVLKLTLEDGSYSWQFVPIAGRSFTDSGTGTCHTAPAPTAESGGPYRSEGTVTFDGSASSDPSGTASLTYAWDFGDGTTGDGISPTHDYETSEVYTVALTVTNSRGVSSAPDTTTATIQNQPPAVNAGGDLWTPPIATVTLEATFTDPGVDDAPWIYTIDWGDGSTDTGTAMSQADVIRQSHAYAVPGAFVARVTVTDKDGGAGWDEATILVANSSFIVAVGDIADCLVPGDDATATMVDTLPGTVLTLGDNAYEDGTATDFANCYEPTWGRHKARTMPSPGNHDYHTIGATGYYDYFGASAGEPGKGYYSFDVGSWHLISLNSEISMSETSAQVAWLRQDLAANPAKCTLAYWHRPRFSSGVHGTSTLPLIVWRALYDAGADLVLVGHDHNYERFAPQTPDGVRDDTRGIRQFVVGTGGHDLRAMGTLKPNSEFWQNTQDGVLRLEIFPEEYRWSFIGASQGTVLDSGSGACH